MKFLKRFLAAVLVLLFSAQIAGAQNISLNVQNTPLKEVLNQIQKQTDYTFVYNDALIGAKNVVTLNVKNENLTTVLDKILTPNAISYKIIDKQIALSPIIENTQPAQTTQSGQNNGKPFSLKGRIIDENGEPVPGVTIRNKKDDSYTLSDERGDYELLIKDPKGAELEYIYLGMHTLVETLNGRTQLNVTLKEDKEMLDEVVVTGFQDIQKKKVTGAIATISSSKIEERYTPSILNNLEGRVAGLSTYGGKLTIRGVSSIYAEANPLVVLDGLPIEGSIDDINPYDVESINVLKDAAAAAIYGARASNGIIVITTKNAKSKGKIDVSFSSNVTIFENQNVDYHDNFYMNAEEQVKTLCNYYDYYFFNNDGEVIDPIGNVENAINMGFQDVDPIKYAYYQHAKGSISRQQLDAEIGKYKTNNFAQEYADAVYRRHVLQQYNLALRSRAENFQSNFVINYKKDNSGIINTFNEQFNLSFKGVYDVTKWLTATLNVNGIYGNGREKGYDYNGVDNIWAIGAFESMYEADGSPRLFYSWYNGNRYWDGTATEGLTDLGINIVDEYYNNTRDTKTQYMRYHGDLLFKIIEGLTANAQFVYESNHTTSDWNALESSHAVRSMKNAYAYYDYKGDVAYYIPSTGGFKNAKNTDGRHWTGRGQVNYSNTFGKHSITALAGTEFRETLTKGTNALMLGYDDQLQTASTQIVDFATISNLYSTYGLFMPDYGYPALQFAYEPYIADNMSPVKEIRHRYASVYANATYTFDEKYNIFGSYRKDYADVYGLNIEFRGKPLWSVGASWNINNEEFMKSINWVNALKLRISYGVTGNIYQNATSYMTASVQGLNYYSNLPYAIVESPANPNLKWEQTRTSNIGVDFALIDNRVRGALDFYIKSGRDLFSNRAIDPTTGFTSMFMNSANMINKGVELAVSADWFRGLKRDDFGWTTGLTFALNRNKITSIENPSTQAYEIIEYTPFVVGYPTSALWSYRFAGISPDPGYKGQIMFYDENDGIVRYANSIDALEYSGQSEPIVIASLDNRLSWKGFSLNVLMAYYGGHKMRALQEQETFEVPTSAIPSYFLNAWTPENPTDTPGIGRYSSDAISSDPLFSNKCVYDASFLKIRNIVLGYELPEKWLEKAHIGRTTLTFQVDNPGAIWKANKVGVDPETLGIRARSSYIFGINVNF